MGAACEGVQLKQEGILDVQECISKAYGWPQASACHKCN